MNKQNKENKNMVVTEDNYREKVLKTMIILCWIILGVCFAVKLFGGNFFEIVCNNERFIKVCKYIDKNFAILFVVQVITYSIGTFFYLVASSNTILKSRHSMILLILTIIIAIVKNILLCIDISVYIPLTLEMIVLILIPITHKTKWWKSILFYLILNIFSIISGFTKSVFCIVLPDYSLIALIFLIDYYIMIFLFFLYAEKLKRRNNMGKWGIGWLHKEVTKYETIKAKNLKRIEELQDENKEIDKKIAELKKQEESK